ncbi:MAG TPA: biotin--[acetyl-CoA-carboxylase] ligase, partial [Bacteroidia bacterium]|nr:biotin--[acetyl-CoA-carboxylase] ligase [Bacteroidia bacterium]
FANGLLRTSSVAEGTVVTARSQFAGRGQRGASWLSGEGQNITCSIILRPVFLGASRQFDLTRAVALGITDLLLSLVPKKEFSIKWPNDIYTGGKKICGILIENQLSGNSISASVVGIGLNVNQAVFPAGVPDAVSLCYVADRKFNVEEVLQQLFGFVEARYLQLRAGSTKELGDEYESRLYRKGVPAKYTDFKTVFTATLDHVTPGGRLVLKMESGETREFGFRELGWL